MAPRNLLGKVTDTAVGVIASGVRAAATLISGTADRAKGIVGMSDAPEPADTIESAAPAPVTDAETPRAAADLDKG